jgi:hypothetical protein
VREQLVPLVYNRFLFCGLRKIPPSWLSFEQPGRLIVSLVLLLLCFLLPNTSGQLLHAAAIEEPAASTTPFATKPTETVLLLGDHTVASTSGLTQRFFAAGKHPANPVMRQTENWEGVGPYIWGNRLMQDERTGLFRLWYITYDFAGNFYRWGYATSPDGLTWTKPNLGVERYADAPATNLLPLGPHPEKGTRSIARDPRPETPAERRYLGVRFTYDGEFVSFSPDGISWKEHPLSPSWFVPSDIIHVMWDEQRNKFTAYFKLWEVAGTEVLDSGPERPFLAYMPTFTNTKLSDGKEAFEGPVIHLRPNAAAEVKKTKFVLRSVNQGKDDGGGASLSGSWTAKRVQAWASSNDGIHWENEQVVLRADQHDPPSSNIQYMFVMQHGGYYLGFITMHDESGYFREQFAWSADGIKWHRPWRKPWLDVGPKGAFDMGMVTGPCDPIITEREMWFPYGGFPILHNTTDQSWKSNIGLATLRLDGFCAWEAGAKPGELLTQPFLCNGDRLFVNAESQHGSLTVEVVGENGKPLVGFQSDACQVVAADTLATDKKIDGWITWKNNVSLGRAQGQRIQLRFRLKNARLYSFRIANEGTINLPVPRATTR